MKYRWLMRVIRLLLVGIGVYSLVFYFSCRKELGSGRPIDYTYEGRRERKGGRGSSYEMRVRYQDRHYTLSITSDLYAELGSGRLPRLYYNSVFDKVISAWQETLALRICGLMLFLLGLTFLPYRKWSRAVPPATS